MRDFINSFWFLALCAAAGVAIGLLLPVPGHSADYFGVVKDCTATTFSSDRPIGCRTECIARRPSLTDCLVAVDAENNRRRAPGFLGFETATCTKQVDGDVAPGCPNGWR